jgi:transposase-like protein
MANQYKCEECGATFSSAAALEEHNRSMHSRYTCEACGEIFNSENELTTHNRVTHPEQEETPRR